ncbi:MAG: transporter associated domain-containing protein, partial [Planctomycetota bacterium]
ALPEHASRDEVVELAKRSRLTHLPVHRGSLDRIVGILDVRRFLLDRHRRQVTQADVAGAAVYVPQIATLDQLLDHFRRTNTDSAIVVDEYGGTAGVVAIADVVEELVGEIPGSIRRQPEPPREIAPNRWRVEGNFGLHEWGDLLAGDLVSTRASTMGGLIIERLGRAPEPGDHVDVGSIRLEVEQVDGPRVATAIVSVRASGPDETADDDGGGAEEHGP